MNNKLNYLLIPLLVVSLSGNILFYLKIGNLKKEIQNISQYQNKNQSLPTTKDKTQNKNNEITYATFSSPKADFTFEYPSNWVYDEREVSSMYDGKEIKTMSWGFYPNLEGDYRNRPPYLEVHSPTYETVDFCSGGPATAKGDPYGFTISVFPTNDPETFVTYEQCGIDVEGGGGYIYWQKGKYFANATDIDDIYYKVNLMIFYSAEEGQDGQEIAQHIAKNIKIK